MLLEEMVGWVQSRNKNDRVPMYVISYNRLDAPTLLKMQHYERTDDITVVVREEQAVAYRKAFPMLDVVGLPADRIGSCGAARWGAFDVARARGQDEVIMLDDDVLQFRFMYQRAKVQGQNVGELCSGVASTADAENYFGSVPLMEEAALTAFGHLGIQVFDEQSYAVVGGMIKRHMSFAIENHRTRYILNGGATPRQAMIWDIARMERYGIRLNLDHFGVTGEDIGLMATVLQKDLDVFCTPSFAFDHWPEEVNLERSLIRDANTLPLYMDYEYEVLQNYQIGPNYLKEKRIPGSEHGWKDVSWQKLAKFRGEPTQRFDWPADAERREQEQALL
jgi:hypothetical protein